MLTKISSGSGSRSRKQTIQRSPVIIPKSTRKNNKRKKVIIVLTKSAIKQEACRRVFSGRDFILHFQEIPDNPLRAPQPISLKGTKEAGTHRIRDYLENRDGKYLQYKDAIILSIESGIMSFDDSIDPDEYTKQSWADVCVLSYGKSLDNIKYVVCPWILGIDPEYTREYFKDGKIHPDPKFDTLGKMIVEMYETKTGKKISHNNWMKDVVGIDRTDQIENGLRELHKKLREVS
jgi:hypothetical protein